MTYLLTCLLTHRTARRAGMLCGLLLAVIGSVALAQTSSPAETGTAPAHPSAKDDEPPPGACKPIGLTVSGEVVFPLECRDFIERHKAMTERPPAPPETRPAAAAAEAKPVAPEAKPATVEVKPATAEVKPATAEEKPTGSTEEPAAVEEKPAAVEAKPLPAETKPAAETTPAAAETKPAPKEETPLAKQSAEATADDAKPAVKPDDTASRKRADNRPHDRSAGPPGCTRFRSYNAASGTYRDFDGRTRPCR
jgi:BA14K-like protein